MLDSMLGAAGGGLLGQLGDALSAPRRALWSGIAGALGKEAPESGADLIQQLTGIDRSSLMGQGLGFGAEVAGDPLTWGGGLLARLLGRGIGSLGRRLGGAGSAAGEDIALANGAGMATGLRQNIMPKTPLPELPPAALQAHESPQGIWARIAEDADVLAHPTPTDTPSTLADNLKNLSGDAGFTSKASYAPGAAVAEAPAAEASGTPLADLLEKMAAAEQSGNKVGFRDVLASRRKTPVYKQTASGGEELLAGPAIGNSMLERKMVANARDVLGLDAEGVYSHMYNRPSSGTTGIIGVKEGASLPLDELRRHELSHALTANAPADTTRGILGKAANPLTSTPWNSVDSAVPEVSVAQLVDEALANVVQNRQFPRAGIHQFLTGDMVSPYLRQHGLLNTPYEEFARNVAPATIARTRGSLADYLSALSQAARARGLSLAGPAAGGGLAALLARENS